jgi:uncharacterized RDD family membrane protein YckC
VVVTGRAGASVGRRALRSARAVVQPVAEPAVRRGAQELADASEPAIERAVDLAFASPLPEAVSRSLVEHRVVERAAAEVVASADLAALVEQALGSEATERLVRQVLASPSFERLLTEALESRLTAELIQRVAASPEIDRAVEQVASSPAVRRALMQQTTSLVEEVAAGVRTRAARVDDGVEEVARRAVHHPRRAVGDEAGVASRAVALVIDIALAHIVFLVGAGTVALVASLVGDLHPTWLFEILAASGWLLVVATYFVLFWSSAGQTPGMRLMRLRVTDSTGARFGAGRALVRLVGLWLAIIPLFAGFLPVLFDDRRRALQDFLARTVVRYDRRDAVLDANVAAASTSVERLGADVPGGLTQS